MKYSVKLILRHTVESGEVFIEESIIMLNAASFDDAYQKAEQYVSESKICSSYVNMFGKQVQTEVVSYADCFSVYDDSDIIEVYSSLIRSREDLSGDLITSILDASCSREDVLPLRQWPDPDFPEEVNAGES